MNGAHALLRTLVANGVDTCFTNPGTSAGQLTPLVLSCEPNQATSLCTASSISIECRMRDGRSPRTHSIWWAKMRGCV